MYLGSIGAKKLSKAIFRVGLAGLLTAPLWVGPARAGCAPPEITSDDFDVAPGDEIEVTGRFWTDTCDDTGGSGGACADDGFDEGHPIQDIRLVLEKKRSNERAFLVEVDAGDDFGFRTEVVVPEVEPGLYVITDDAGTGYFESGAIRVRRTSS